MLKLLQINVTANWGSTGKIAESIGLAAMAHGWESYIAYGRLANPSKSKLIKVGNVLDVYWHYGEQRLLDNEGLSSRKSTRLLVEKIKEIKPHIIQLHNLHDHWINYKILFDYINNTNIKVVWTFHDFWAITGHCMHFYSKNCTRYQTGCYDCPMKRIYPKTILDNSESNWNLKKRMFTSNKNLTIVSVSQWVHDITLLSFLKNKQIHIINNGVDTDVFAPTQLSLEYQKVLADKFVIMSVASQWKIGKGLDDYKEMSKLLKDDEVIVLVGIDDEINRGLPDNIIGLRRINDLSILASLYTRADVITVFSSAETFGLTVVEGYACGTPAVVYDNTAPPSLITTETGIVVPDKDYNKAYEAVQEIKKKGKSYYSETCRKIALEHYSNKKCYEQYIALYNELLKNG